ncbi:MAG: hypothetical protein SchgKO_02580 [Schleiferiaceae bacterium]
MPVSATDGEITSPNLSSDRNHQGFNTHVSVEMTTFVGDVMDESIAQNLGKTSGNIQEIPASSRKHSSFRFPRFESAVQYQNVESNLHVVVDENGWLSFDEHQIVEGSVLEIIDYREVCVLFAKELKDTPVSTNHLPSGVYKVVVTSHASKLSSKVILK